MSSLYKRNGSPFWWLKWRNSTTRRIEQFSTGFRWDLATDRVRAVHLRHTYALKENSTAGQNNPFSEWVLEFLENSHALAPSTLGRYLTIWKTLATYLDACDITSPHQVTRQVALGYISWRKKVPHINRTQPGGKAVCRNTMLLELKVLIKILQEAVVREYIDFNPCLRLKLGRDPSRPKEEISDAQYKIIRRQIDLMLKTAVTEPEIRIAVFLDRSFEIARLQGIRMCETYIPMDNVDLDRATILIHGKGHKLEEVNLNPNLAPLFEQLKAAGATHTFTLPAIPGIHWFKLFKGIRRKHPGFKNISFHSTRVTVISRMERAGVPENVMMRTVLHSSTTVHRVYRKVKPSELKRYWHVLGSTAHKPDSPGTPGVPSKIQNRNSASSIDRA